MLLKSFCSLIIYRTLKICQININIESGIRIQIGRKTLRIHKTAYDTVLYKERKELLPVAVPVLGLLQCRGILHAQQQAAQQHLGVRRLHLHLKRKDDI
jgi:hypothetical protein